MLTMIKNFFHAFLFDELAAKRWIRGGLNSAALIAAQVIVDPTWSTWGFKEWCFHAIPSVVAFAAGSVTAGEKNPKPPPAA